MFKHIKGFIKTVRNIIKSVIDNDFFGAAAEMGFWLVIGIFPFMIFLMAVFAWIGKHSFMQSVFLFLENIMPIDSIELIKIVLNEVMFFAKGGFLAVLGFVITLILSTNTMAIILKGLNRAYKVEETRSFVYTRILSLFMVLVNTMVLFLSINLIIFGKIFIEIATTYFSMTDLSAHVILISRWPVAFLALYIMAFLMYYILPDLKSKETLKIKSSFWGTLWFCALWLIGSWGFSIYINNLHTYNFVYGTIGAFAVLMVWLYYTSILILIGGEINSQHYYKLLRADNINQIREEKIN